MILDDIMAHKRDELKLRQRAEPLAELQVRRADRPPPLDFAAALRGSGVHLIAEVKRASPSRGVFRADLDAVLLARTYAANGAAAISVLTDSAFFHGQLDSLLKIKSDTTSQQTGFTNPQPPIPILRKDFIFEPYQVYESAAYGADALLLIARVLSDEMLDELLALTQQLGMTPLVEVHSEEEMERVLPFGPQVVGINNRNLNDFGVDLRTFGRLRRFLPDGVIAVAESGVHTAADVRRLGEMGADAVLVGEALVTAPDVPAKVRELAGIGRTGTGAQSSESARR